MKIASFLLISAFAAISLSGCSGYPMTVESRTPPSATQQEAIAAQQAVIQHRQLSRSRGAW